MWDFFLLWNIGCKLPPSPHSFVCLMTLSWQHQNWNDGNRKRFVPWNAHRSDSSRCPHPQHALPRPVFLWITRCLKIDQWSTSEWAGISGPRKMSEITKDEGESWKVKTKTREQQTDRRRKDTTRWTHESQKRGFNPGLRSPHHHQHHHRSDPADDEDDSYLTELSGLHHC